MQEECQCDFLSVGEENVELDSAAFQPEKPENIIEIKPSYQHLKNEFTMLMK